MTEDSCQLEGWTRGFHPQTDFSASVGYKKPGLWQMPTGASQDQLSSGSNA
jgi:hypothetical protein